MRTGWLRALIQQEVSWYSQEPLSQLTQEITWSLFEQSIKIKQPQRQESYDTILEDATSVKWIIDRLASACKLNSGNQYILNSHMISYNPEQGDTPEKLYLRIRTHYAQAAPQAGTTFDNREFTEDVKINELCELMFVELTLTKIDRRLPAHVQASRAHLMHGGKTLFCIKRLLWDQMDMMLTEINEKEDLSATVSFARSNFRQNKQQTNKSSRSYNQERNKPNFCGACFRAKKSERVYTSHEIANCTFLSKEEKAKIIKAPARLLTAEDDNADQDEENVTDLTGGASSDSSE